MSGDARKQQGLKSRGPLFQNQKETMFKILSFPKRRMMMTRMLMTAGEPIFDVRPN